MDKNVRSVGTNIIQCLDTSQSKNLEFHFDHLFGSQHDFAKSSYNLCIAPLVKEAIEGGSAIALFGGQQSLHISHFLLSQTLMQGLISEAATQMIAEIHDSQEKTGSVTFSWYKIDAQAPEVITDILKAASHSQQPNDVKNEASSAGLMLRELGKGRGMTVPSLWEVEIANGSDIEAVVNHVLKIIPQVADHSLGTSHTVMQLTITNYKLAQQQQQQMPTSHTTTGSATLASQAADGPGVGRVSFLLLSNLAPPSGTAQPTTGKKSATAAHRSSIDHPFPWVDQTYIITQWLQAKRPSPPFHKSRLLLLLKDVLLRRQRASMVLLVQPSEAQHESNLKWFKLFAQLGANFMDHVDTSATATKKLPSSRSKTPMRMQQSQLATSEVKRLAVGRHASDDMDLIPSAASAQAPKSVPSIDPIIDLFPSFQTPYMNSKRPQSTNLGSKKPQDSMGQALNQAYRSSHYPPSQQDSSPGDPEEEGEPHWSQSQWPAQQGFMYEGPASEEKPVRRPASNKSNNTGSGPDQQNFQEVFTKHN